MSFYSLPKKKRILLTDKIAKEFFADIKCGGEKKILLYFSDEDTYIRKAGYLAIGRIYHATDTFRNAILKRHTALSEHENAKVRQTALNAAGKIAMKDFYVMEELFHKALLDEQYSVRNAVIGSIKKADLKRSSPI